jgi:ABC-2 type transport system ATP-binding protein
MNEMAVTADHLIVIGRGKLIADAATQDLIARAAGQSVRVTTPDPDRLTDLITPEGGKVTPAGPANGTSERAENASAAVTLTVTGMPAPRIGELAASAAVVLHELTPQRATLEEAFLELTSDSLEFGHEQAAAPVQVSDGSSR